MAALQQLNEATPGSGDLLVGNHEDHRILVEILLELRRIRLGLSLLTRTDLSAVNPPPGPQEQQT